MVYLETKMENKMIEIARSLYTDIFASGNCPAVDSHYHTDAICHFNGRDLTIASLKASMCDFVAQHSDIKTNVESLIASGDRTFARLTREVTEKETGRRRQIHIMVEKRFVGDKIKELWFMVDDDKCAAMWDR